jgi:hypothetical protein
MSLMWIFGVFLGAIPWGMFHEKLLYIQIFGVVLLIIDLFETIFRFAR